VRVLWLTPELPYAPGGSGGSNRQFHLLRRLVERGWEAECVAPVHPAQREGAELLRAAGVRLHAVERPPSRVAEVLRAVRSRPGLLPAAATRPLFAWQVEVFWTAMRPLAEQVIAERRPDVLAIEHDWAASWPGDLAPGIPLALTLENLSWEYYEARAAAAGGAQGAALALEARRFARFDRRHLRRYDLLIAMSEDDRAAVRAVSDVRCEVVPNGVDTSTLDVGPPADAPVAIFTGNLAYPPNAEGLLWLLRDIWPRVRAAVPDARLVVVGRGAPDEAARLADDSVELAGWVDDLRGRFEQAAVVLVPIRSGGGTRLKVLDGLASGRPVVSTALGAMGIEARGGEHLVLAEGAEPFAAAVVRLLEEPAERARIGGAGRALAVERYDWDALGDRLSDALASIASPTHGLG
jgi:glycosyltransferase involved in cell wall biosynthesis